MSQYILFEYHRSTADGEKYEYPVEVSSDLDFLTKKCKEYNDLSNKLEKLQDEAEEWFKNNEYSDSNIPEPYKHLITEKFDEDGIPYLEFDDTCRYVTIGYHIKALRKAIFAK